MTREIKAKVNQIILNSEYLEEEIKKLIAENTTLKDLLERSKEENKELQKDKDALQNTGR